MMRWYDDDDGGGGDGDDMIHSGEKSQRRERTQPYMNLNVI